MRANSNGSKGRRAPTPTDPDDVPELTSEWFESADVMEGDRVVRRGRPVLPEAERKIAVTLRIDPAVLEAFRAGGDGWQTRMHEVLQRHVARSSRSKRRAA